MDWNFFDIAKEFGLYVGNIAQAPRTTGCYMLFAENGEFIYAGKADDLHERLTDHFGPNEKNEKIKGIAKYVIWEQTRTIDEAEELEGYLYDAWFRITGRPPSANKIKPPKSKLSDDEIRIAQLRQILEALRSTKRLR